MWYASATFIRHYRQKFLEKSGLPRPGQDRLAAALLDAIRLAQCGQVSEALENIWWGWGIDLNYEYQKYKSEMRRNHGR